MAAWTNLMFGTLTQGSRDFSALCFKEIKVIFENNVTSLWNSVPNTGLKNISSWHAYSHKVVETSNNSSTANNT